MDTRTELNGRTNTDKKKKVEIWLHAFTGVKISDNQMIMVKDEVSLPFNEN